MNNKVAVSRFVLSHGIVLVIFFQLGLLFGSYDGENDPSLVCECPTRAPVQTDSSPATTNDDDRKIIMPEATDIDPFTVSRLSANALKMFLQGNSTITQQDNSNDDDEALVLRYRQKSTEATTMSPITPLSTLKDCTFIKVFQENLMDNACLLVAPSEESYHVYRWEKQGGGTSSAFEAGGNNNHGLLYHPVARIRNDNPVSTADPMNSFYWAQQFTLIQEQVANDLQQVLHGQQVPAYAMVRLVVVDKQTAPLIIPHIVKSSLACSNEDPSRFFVLLWCIDFESHEMAAQQHSFLSSYYNPTWPHAANLKAERLPNHRFLVAELLAVQQLLLQGYHVWVDRDMVDKRAVHHYHHRHPLTMNAHTTLLADVTTLTPKYENDASIFAAPTCLIKSNVRTKALWSKLVLSLDNLQQEGTDSLDAIVLNYAALFGIQLISTTMQKAISSQILKACAITN